MARTGKKNTKSAAAKKREAEKIAQENKKRLYDEIAAIILLAFGVFLAIAMHTDFAGAFGEMINSFLKGMFGLGGFVLPYFLIVYSCMMFAKMNRPFRGKTLILLLLIFIMIDLMNAGRFLSDFDISLSGGIADVFEDGIALKNGGLAGMYIGWLIVKAIGVTGLYIFSSVVILICVLLTVNTPISKAYDNAKLKKIERAEKREQRLKEKSAREDEMKAVAIDAKTDFIAERYDPSKEKKKKSIIDILKNDDKFGLKPEKEEEPVFEPTETLGITEEGFASRDKEVIKKNKEDKAEEEMFFAGTSGEKNGSYKLPPVSLLKLPGKKRTPRGKDVQLSESAKLLEETLKSFNVEAKVVNVTKGSSVTRYEIQPAIGVKVASIVRLADDIALNLRARSIRIEAPIPGKAAVGIEVENETRETVTIGELVDSREFKQNASKLAFAVGKDIGGIPVIADLAKMPHMLIAGATGSGKSVCINTIIASILYRATPDEVKLLLIDPKMVELGNYNGIPHLLIPVVTDSAKATAALNWAVAEMTDRYKKFAASGVREIKSYNALMKKNNEEDEILPQIVIIIDELADLMMVASSQVEDAICRLAQLARAAGMHLIVATQRPSVDVVTGLIKANIPSRIAFMVSSQIDSRTIIDMPGAEKLVGNGDMLYKPQDMDKPLRVQGPFISDDEVRNIIDFVKAQNEEANYDEEIITHVEKGNNPSGGDDTDELMDDAIETVVRAGQASVSMLQRRFRIGYNRAARIIEDMEARGIVGPQDGSRPRTVLMTEEELIANKPEAEE